MNAKAFVFFVLSFIQISCHRIVIPNELFEVDNSPSDELRRKHVGEFEYETTRTTPPPQTTTEDYCICGSENAAGCSIESCPDDDRRAYDAMFLITASQVILGTAIIMGLSALVTLLLRACSRRRYPAQSQNVDNLPDEFGRMGLRASLSSLQQRVMSKLRDRPPRYETRHNYDYQRQQRSTRIAVLNPGAVSATDQSNVPPPAYESNDEHSLHELPPAYTIAADDTGGILNHSFVREDSTRNQVDSASTESDINRNRTADNVLHI